MTAIQHIALNCRNLKKSEAFYTKHFGFCRARVFNRGQPNEFIMLRVKAACLELFEVPKDIALSVGGEQPVGFKHLAFEVDDIDAMVKRLRADGIETGEIVDCSNVIEGARVCFFRDPDGNWLELIEGYRDEIPA